MNEIDITFFEAYKRLDKLCMDLLSSNTGVKNPYASYAMR